MSAFRSSSSETTRLFKNILLPPLLSNRDEEISNLNEMDNLGICWIECMFHGSRSFPSQNDYPMLFMMLLMNNIVFRSFMFLFHLLDYIVTFYTYVILYTSIQIIDYASKIFYWFLVLSSFF